MPPDLSLEPTRHGALSIRGRLLALVLTLAIGVLLGTVGYLFSGSQAWFLAVPVCLAVVWFIIADPTRCVQEPEPGERSRQDGERRV